MAEQSYGTWKDWLLCLAAIIFMRTPSWHSSRWYKRHPQADLPKIQPIEIDKPKKSGWHRFLDFMENGMFLVLLSVIGSLVGGIVYTPIFVVSGDSVALLALHRSRAVADKSKRIQIFWYSVVFVVMTAILLWVGALLRDSTRQLKADLAATVVELIKPLLVRKPTPVKKAEQDLGVRHMPVTAPIVLPPNSGVIINPGSGPVPAGQMAKLKEMDREAEEAKQHLTTDPDQLVLHDLFLTDFSSSDENTSSVTSGFVIRNDQTGITTHIEYRIVRQLTMGTKILLLYIPPTDETPHLCVTLSYHYDVALADFMEGRTDAIKIPGDSEQMTTQDSVLSKRMFIYNETYLSPEQVIKSSKAFKKRSITVILRSSDYLANRRLEAKVKRLENP
jgi:hypothetical protein